MKNLHVTNVEFYTGVDERLPVPIMLPPMPTWWISRTTLLIADYVADTGATLKLVRDFCAGHVADVRCAVVDESRTARHVRVRLAHEPPGSTSVVDAAADRAAGTARCSTPEHGNRAAPTWGRRFRSRHALSARRSASTSRRSASSTSRSAMERRSNSMSQWVRGGLTFFCSGSVPSTRREMLPVQAALPGRGRLGVDREGHLELVTARACVAHRLPRREVVVAITVLVS